MARGLPFYANDGTCVRASMVVSAPFIRWDIITYGSGGSTRDGVYYFETAQGERVVCAVAVPCEGNRMVYRPLDSFLEDYRPLLPSGPALEWNFIFQLGAWLDGIVYYSFLRYSQQGVDSCWHFCSVCPDDVTQRLPLGLRRHFRSSGPSTWILVVHGYRFWPVEVVGGRFGHGWDEFHAVHKLKPGFKVIFACKRKWIFHTLILDEDDLELRFRWSGQNVHCRELHPPSGIPPHALTSAITLSSTANIKTKLQTQLINIQGIARVTNFSQRFYYLACSLCNKATNAYQSEDLWCNYCAKKVAPLIRIKFNIEIEDATAAIEAAVFPEIAEAIYGITGSNIASTAPGESLPTEILEKLNEPKNSNITLRAYTYTYAGISQLRFTVHSMSINAPGVLALTPPTPAKTEKTHAASTSEDPIEANPAKKQKQTTV